MIEKTVQRQLSPARSVGAVGGMEAAVEGVRAMMDGRFPGKILIFPQASGLPLTGLDELPRTEPADRLSGWGRAACGPPQPSCAPRQVLEDP